MADPDISGIAPFFIVRNVPAALSFYHDRLGFAVTFQGPAVDIFFGIVQRGAPMIMLKAVGVDPVPNHTRDVKKGNARWDAYLVVPDPDALAAEFSSRVSTFPNPSKIPMMACAGSKSRTPTATSCSSAVPVHERSVARPREALREG